MRRFAGSANRQPVTLARQPDGGAILARRADGACVFFDAAGGRRCAVHRELGEAVLPSACRQFPRVTLTDSRARWISLSHFCPTAAALLFTAAPVRIVDAPESISLHGAAEGLDAAAALPPLLRPGMLMDYDGYDAWERGAIELLCTHGANAGQAVAALDRMTRVIQRWSPGHGLLSDCVRQVFAEGGEGDAAVDQGSEREDYALALAAVSDGLDVPFAAPSEHLDVAAVEIIWNEFDGVIRRYLAAKLFGCWWPYLGLDLAAVVRAIQVHASVLRMRIEARVAQGDRGRQALLEAIRQSDLLMVHLADGPTLARSIVNR